jgi:hypothetical protein
MASRPMTSAVLAALIASAKRPVLFYYGEFASGAVYAWTGLGPRVWNGETWLGTGGLIQLGSVPETTDVMAQQVVITVSGIDPETLALVLNEGGHNLAGKVWLGFLDDSGAVVADPLLLHAGLLDITEITENVAGPTIQLTYQNRLADFERPRLYNYTSADQQRISPGDTGFDFAPAAQEFNGSWGTPP